jgi:DNA-binding MarR family transcriptional regulator
MLGDRSTDTDDQDSTIIVVSPPPADDHAAYPRISYLVGRLDRAVRRRLEDVVRPLGVTVAGYTVLSLLADRPGQSNAQLARRSFMTPQAMNQVIRRLADDGLVERKVSPNHARIQLTNLTMKGRNTLRACDRAADGVEARMVGDMSQPRMEELTGELLRAVRDLEHYDD